MRVQKKAFAYRVPIGDYNYLQCLFQGSNTLKNFFVMNSTGKSKLQSLTGPVQGQNRVFPV